MPRRRSQLAEYDASPIRVGLLILELSRGGAETALVRLVKSLDKRRFSPIVYSMSSREQDLQNSLAPELRAAGTPVVELGIRGMSDVPASLWKLVRHLKQDRVEILQSFMFHANFVGRFAGWLAGTSVICSGVRVAEREAPKRLALDRMTRGLVDAWICVGESVAEFTRGTGIPASRVFSIPNGIEDFTQDPKFIESLSTHRDAFESCASAGKRRAVCVGRLTRQKGFDWLLERLASQRDEPELRGWEFWIVGEGEERGALERLCHAKGLDGIVQFVGWRADAREIIASSDLFLLPSRWEGMPNALLEAAISGRATLCRRVEGVSEILDDSTPEGLMQTTTVEDVDEWLEKSARLFDDAKLRQELGDRNRRRALEFFSVSATTRRYEELWLQLLRTKLES